MSNWKKPLTDAQKANLEKFYRQSRESKAEIAKRLQIDPSTAYRHLKNVKRSDDGGSDNLTEQTGGK